MAIGARLAPPVAGAARANAARGRIIVRVSARIITSSSERRARRAFPVVAAAADSPPARPTRSASTRPPTRTAASRTPSATTSSRRWTPRRPSTCPRWRKDQRARRRRRRGRSGHHRRGPRVQRGVEAQGRTRAARAVPRRDPKTRPPSTPRGHPPRSLTSRPRKPPRRRRRRETEKETETTPAAGPPPRLRVRPRGRRERAEGCQGRRHPHRGHRVRRRAHPRRGRRRGGGEPRQDPLLSGFEEALGVAVSAYYANKFKGSFLTAAGRESLRLGLVEKFTRPRDWRV